MTTIVLSGSGLSAESGIPTFYGAGGLYEVKDVQSLLTEHTLRRQPAVIHELCDRLRSLVAAARPNAAHVALADFARREGNVVMLTQNVDDLLERAGWPDVVHLHGLITRMRCLGRAHVHDVGYSRDPSSRCVRCNSRLRPDVVLFGEEAPAYRTLYRSLNSATSDDALLVIGTRGAVLPVNEIARDFPGWRGLVNLEPSEVIDEGLFDQVRYGPATVEVAEVLAELGRRP